MLFFVHFTIYLNGYNRQQVKIQKYMYIMNCI